MPNESQTRIVTTEPPPPTAAKLIEAFSEEPAKQAGRYDDLAKEMMKLLLGVPGAYLAVLKFGQDQHHVMQTAGIMLNGLAFAAWCAATFAALRALFPRAYNVMPDVAYPVEDPASGNKLTVAEFYRTAARFKALCLAWSAALFFAGILLAAVSLFFYA